MRIRLVTGRTFNRQKGALMFVTPLLILLVVLIGSLAMDGARLYFQRQKMQSQIDAAVTEAAEFTQSCGSVYSAGNPASEASDITTLAENAAKKAGWDGKATKFLVRTGVIKKEIDHNGDEVNVFIPSANPLEANAVGIKYMRTEPYSWLLPEWLGQGELVVSAAAKKELKAGISVESYTASLDSTQSALLNLVIGGILHKDGGLALKGVNFDSLSGTLVDVEDLVAGLTGGTTAGDILGSDVTAKTVLSVLKSTSNATGDAASALDKVVNAAVGTNTNIALADIVTVLGGDQVPKGAQIPVLDVIISTVFNVGKALPGKINIDLADNGFLGSIAGLVGLQTATLDLTIDQAPGFVFAPARQDENREWYGKAKSADLTLTLNLGLNLSVLGLATLKTSLPLTLNTGSAEVTLVGAQCAAGAGNQVALDVEVQRSLLSLQTSASADLTAVVLFIPITLANPQIVADSGKYGGGREDQTLGPMDLNDSAPYAVELGDSGDALKNATTGLIDGLDIKPNILPGLSSLSHALNGLLGNLVSTVTTILSPVLRDVSQQILGPLVDALGLSVGNARITVASKVQSPVVLLKNVDMDAE